MALLRTEQQAAINELHRAMAKSVDHYVDAAGFLQDEGMAAFLRESAETREQFCDRVVVILDKLDDLPMSPDTEKESLEQLMYRMGAKVSADEVATILQQRLDDEHELHEQLRAIQQLDLDTSTMQLLDEILQHVDHQIEKIQDQLNT